MTRWIAKLMEYGPSARWLALSLLLLLVLAGGCYGDLPTDPPPHQENDGCVWVGDEWVCP